MEEQTEEQKDNIKRRGVSMDVYAEANALIRRLGYYSDERGRAAVCLGELLRKLGKYEEPKESGLK